jgi:hypothetical protein
LTQNPVVKVPPERLDQLKAIAAALDLSLSDTIGHLIRAEIAKGTIADAIPGAIIKRTKGGVRVQLGDQPVRTYTVANALSIAEMIRDVIEGKMGGWLNVDCDFRVELRGNGVVLYADTRGEPKIVSRDVARDIARLIEAAAR